MGLKFYNSNKVAFSDLSDVLITSHNGVKGEIVTALIYLKNDSISVYYDNLTVTPESSLGDENILGIYGNGRGMQLSTGIREPTPFEWDAVVAGDPISLSAIGTSSQADITSYHPFWARITIPGNYEAQSFTDVSLKVAYTEHVVG